MVPKQCEDVLSSKNVETPKNDDLFTRKQWFEEAQRIRIEDESPMLRRKRKKSTPTNGISKKEPKSRQ